MMKRKRNRLPIEKKKKLVLWAGAAVLVLTVACLIAGQMKSELGSWLPVCVILLVGLFWYYLGLVRKSAPEKTAEEKLADKQKRTNMSICTFVLIGALLLPAYVVPETDPNRTLLMTGCYLAEIAAAVLYFVLRKRKKAAAAGEQPAENGGEKQ